MQKNKILTIQLQEDSLKPNIKIEWETVRDIPKEEESFEIVWKKYNNGQIFD